MFSSVSIKNTLLQNAFSGKTKIADVMQEDNHDAEKLKPLPVVSFEEVKRKKKWIKHPRNAGRIGLPLTIRYKGTVDLNALYKMMSIWLKSRRFELYERVYKFRAPEMRYIWEAERKKTHFFLEKVNITTIVNGEHNIEVIEKGKKKKMFRGRVYMTFDGSLETPYKSITGELPWNTRQQRGLLDKLRRFILRSDELFAEDDLYLILIAFMNDVKKQIGMEVI